MQKTKKSFARIIVAFMIIFALAIPMSAIAADETADAAVLTIGATDEAAAETAFTLGEGEEVGHFYIGRHVKQPVRHYAVHLAAEIFESALLFLGILRDGHVVAVLQRRDELLCPRVHGRTRLPAQ